MSNTYKKIAVMSLSDNCALMSMSTSAQSGNYDLNSVATSLMVDFVKTPAITVNVSVTVNDALELMRTNRTRVLLVIDYNGDFAGVITAMDLMGRKPMAYANEAGITRLEVQVKNIMLDKNKLKAIARSDAGNASIGDVLQVLRSLNEQHILVVEGSNENTQISGLFLASDFKRALGMKIDTAIIAHTFSDLERIINENKEVM